MSVIRPFSALLPDATWYRKMLVADKLYQLKTLLEPSNEHPAETQGMELYREALEGMLKTSSYQDSDQPAIFIYERETARGSQVGVWAQTSLSDMESVIVTHENTLEEHLQRHRNYREHVGLEGSPVLLTYPRSGEVNMLVEKVTANPRHQEFYYRNDKHRLWAVKDKRLIQQFEQAFSRIPRVYVADGHHRLAAAVHLHNEHPQWITSLYISAGQLICREFNRTVIPEKPITKLDLLSALEAHFYISAIPRNVPCRPTYAGRMGLCFKREWYQLDIKGHLAELNGLPDVRVLQEKVLEPVFAITDPRNDNRLRSWASAEWEQMLDYTSSQPEAVTFSLSPISAAELLRLADIGIPLPPKSTYIEPKVPFGMLLCNNKSQQECVI